ncbi:uncharacterized protein LOC110686870 [Chenopodium quinoa]|uniref:uncharacterized protein LOC110686870 n=1 Tax=Chenopodium quinoa TaxID=63459 RepID=UPI000B78B55B|nr:uncharacterized protein LOC110686870 [Chenopodium quinoa]
MQSASSGSNWYQLVAPKAYETSGLIHIMTYMIDPISEAYEIWFILSHSSGSYYLCDSVEIDHSNFKLDEIVEVTNLTDNDDNIASNYMGSNEFNDDDDFGDGNNFENEPASTGETNVRSDDVVYEIISILGVKKVARHEKYLGLPTIIGRSKKVVFSCLKERIWKKMQGWKEKLLSQAGREVLIKAVAQAIPTYMMGLFRIPEGLISEIHSMIARFGGEQGERSASFIGLVGRSCACRRHLVEWGFVTWELLIKPYLLNKAGVCFATPILWCIKS